MFISLSYTTSTDVHEIHTTFQNKIPGKSRLATYTVKLVKLVAKYIWLILQEVRTVVLFHDRLIFVSTRAQATD